MGENVVKPLDYYYNNIADTIMLMDVMRNHVCENIIFSSSASTYSDLVEIPITEAYPKGVRANPYG